ncbi:type 1 fimbrial protein [Serratia proteamaculans]|uniref:fimbrial protein n=1 Tax=Serratia proteamaculans TaxID=28151 RepID=UPI001076B560|nr:fimbrial protein [Serratia proteamaculans]TFZ52679.1 type 1 fimbrial protein [Serratia proteamaculans]
MKLAKLALIVGLGMVGINAANAADAGHGTVTFKGSIISAPCSITPDTVDQTVNLGQVSDAALANYGTSTSVPFQISLENCTLTDTSAVTVTFTGQADATDATMLGLNGSAQGAGIVIADQSNSVITLGQATAPQTLQDGNNTLAFNAYLKGNSAAAATPGDFQSVANFTLAYQ